MSYEVLSRIEAAADDIFVEGVEAERIGKVADATAKRMKEAGSIRMLQRRSTEASRSIRASSRRPSCARRR